MLYATFKTQGFACQKVDAIHALPHDIAMDLIVTEEEILSQA